MTAILARIRLTDMLDGPNCKAAYPAADGSTASTASTASACDAGFTLLELMVTLAISAILLGLAVPSFQTLMGESQISSTTNDFVFALQTARSEAIKRSSSVGLCSSSKPVDDAAACDGNVWTDGWIVYEDGNGNGSRESAEDLILQGESLSDAFTFRPDNPLASQVYFTDSGSSSNSAGVPLSGNIQIDFADGQDKRTVTVAANGRISSKK